MGWIGESGYVAPGGTAKTTITVPIGTAAGTSTPSEGSDLLMAVWLAPGNSIASYEWTLEKPYRSALELTNPGTDAPTLPPPDICGEYVVTLVVTDTSGAASAPTTLRIGLDV